MISNIIAIFSFIFLFANLTYAQPANDEPCNASDLGLLVLNTPTLVTGGTNVSATNSSFSTKATQTGNYAADMYLKDVWYKFKLPNGYFSTKVTLTTTSGKKFTMIQNDKQACTDDGLIKGGSQPAGQDYLSTDVVASAAGSSFISVRTSSNCKYTYQSGTFQNGDYVYLSVGGATAADMGTFDLKLEVYGNSGGGCPSCSGLGTMSISGSGTVIKGTDNYDIYDGGTVNLTPSGYTVPTGQLIGIAFFSTKPTLPLTVSQLADLWTVPGYKGSDYFSTNTATPFVSTDNNTAGKSGTIPGSPSTVWAFLYLSDQSNAVDGDKSGDVCIGTLIQLNYTLNPLPPCGTCATPNCPIGSVPMYNDRFPSDQPCTPNAYTNCPGKGGTVCQNGVSIKGTTTTTYQTVVADANGKLGAYVQGINPNTLSFTITSSLYETTNCNGAAKTPAKFSTDSKATGSATNVHVRSAGVGSWNPEWTGLTPGKSYILKTTFNMSGADEINEYCMDFYGSVQTPPCPTEKTYISLDWAKTNPFIAWSAKSYNCSSPIDTIYKNVDINTISTGGQIQPFPGFKMDMSMNAGSDTKSSMLVSVNGKPYSYYGPDGTAPTGVLDWGKMATGTQEVMEPYIPKGATITLSICDTRATNQSFAYTIWDYATGNTLKTGTATPKSGACTTVTFTLTSPTMTWKIDGGTTGVIDLNNGSCSFDPKALAAGNHTLQYTFTNGAGCTVTGNLESFTTAGGPTISPSALPSVCQGTTSTTMVYTSTGTPKTYTIDWNAAANTAGFVDVTNATITASPLTITLPTGAAAATYTGVLTVKNAAGCSSAAQNITVTINAKTTPTFATIPNVCQNATPPVLPTSSTNTPAITGTWSPVVSTASLGTTPYTFTPGAGQCANTATNNIIVSTPVTPTFTPISPLCQGADVTNLPTSSTNTPAITGTWSPVFSTASSGTIPYTFTPTSGQCATTFQQSVVVKPILKPSINCGTSTLTAVVFDWSSLAGATSYVISYTKDGGTAQSGGTISALTYTVSGLQMGGKAIITITPIGTGCYESSTKECIAKNCPSPSISTHPDDVSLCSGKDTKFSASSSPSTGVKYQWQQDGVDVVDGGVYSGSSTNTLIISNVSGLDDKKYHLIVTETSGNCSVTSNDATLNVNEIPVVSLPSDKSYCPGDIVPATSFSSTPTGSSYDWTSSNPSISIVPNASPGIGDLAKFTVSNSTSSSIETTIKVIPTRLTCVGIEKSYKITVNPILKTSVQCGASTLNSVIFDWTSVSGATGYELSYKVNSGNSISLGTVTDLSQKISSLNQGDIVELTVLPKGTGCYESSKTTCKASNCIPAKVLTHPANSTKCSGEATCFTSTYSNQSSVQWEVNTGSLWASVVSSSIYSGETTGTLCISNSTGLNGYKYRLKVNESLASCPVYSNSADFIVNPIPDAKISGSTAVCKNNTAPGVLFTGLLGIGEYTFTYELNTALQPLITSSNGSSFTVNAPTNTVGDFKYNLKSVINNSTGCSKTITGQEVDIKIKEIPSVNQLSNETVCNLKPSPVFTFTSDPIGASFTWTNSNKNTGIAESGNLSTISSVLASNSTNSPIVSLFAVTPTLAGCEGSPMNFNLTVLPTKSTVVSVIATSMDSIAFAWTSVVGAEAYLIEEDAVTTPGNTPIFVPVKTTTDLTYIKKSLTMGQQVILRITPISSLSLICFAPATKVGLAQVCQPANVTSLPRDTAVCTGQSALFSVVVSNHSFIQWQESSDNGLNWFDIQDVVPYANAKTQLLTISDITGLNNRKYKVKLRGTLNACPTEYIVTLTEKALPVINFDARPKEGCRPLTVSFFDLTSTSDPNPKYEWDFGDNSTSSKSKTVDHIYDKANKFTVGLKMTANGCVNSKTFVDFINVNEKPKASFKIDQTTLSQYDPKIKTINTSSQDATFFKWTFGDGSPISNDKNAEHTFDPAPESYLITLTSYVNTNCFDTYSTTIMIPEDVIYYIPNTFTPNGDENNNTFHPIFFSGFDPQNYSFLIYNRWGDIVFESLNTEVGWDGTYLNKLLANGVYTWKLGFKEKKTENEHRLTGHVNLLR
jgi:gliding motility-associated-like protein